MVSWWLPAPGPQPARANEKATVNPTENLTTSVCAIRRDGLMSVTGSSSTYKTSVPGSIGLNASSQPGRQTHYTATSRTCQA